MEDINLVVGKKSNKELKEYIQIVHKENLYLKNKWDYFDKYIETASLKAQCVTLEGKPLVLLEDVAQLIQMATSYPGE